MKSNSFNNLLSFLITSILIFMLGFIMINMAVVEYKRAKDNLEAISVIEDEKSQLIEDILNDMEGAEETVHVEKEE